VISVLEQKYDLEAEDFLASIYGEEIRLLAQRYIKSMRSHDYRKPTFLVKILDKKIIGIAAFSEELFTINVWGISWVSVDVKYRSQGIGQELVESCLHEISKNIDQDVTALLATYPGQTKLYENIGFIGTTPDHSGGVFMSKTIKPQGQTDES